MGNRLTAKQRWVVAGGCVFAALCLFSYHAMAAGMSIEVAASGDRVFMDSSFDWIGSNADIQTLPQLVCGQEVLTGWHSTRILSRDATLRSSQEVNDTEIMIFTSELGLVGQGSILEENTGLFSVDAGATTGTCHEQVNSTTYNEMARVSSSFMGDSLTYQSQGGVIQASDEFPDGLAFHSLAQGSGRAGFEANVLSQIGLGNSSAVILENSMNTRVSSGGRNIQLEGMFEFTTFTYAFNGSLLQTIEEGGSVEEAIE